MSNYLAFKRLLRCPEPTPSEAYFAGVSSAVGGPNETNSHFRFFQTTRLTRHWEQGAADARREANV